MNLLRGNCIESPSIARSLTVNLYKGAYNISVLVRFSQWSMFNNKSDKNKNILYWIGFTI